MILGIGPARRDQAIASREEGAERRRLHGSTARSKSKTCCRTACGCLLK